MSFLSVLARHSRLLVAAVLVGLLVWILFLDSHSVVDRVRWHQEHAELTQENEHLQAQIDTLQAQLDRPLSDDIIERIAREQYGMQREGETIYPIETPE